VGTIIETILILSVLLAGFVTFLAICVFIANQVVQFIRQRRTTSR
jgi:hypothetical protein